ncbi:MAG: rane protein [Marmoricola sp.]|nr:rane protein [Marmoricola sp.]
MNDPSRIRTAFRVIAFAEACSWLGLLIGMYIKYVPETTEAGVKIFGPIHGGIFVAYLLVTLTARSTFGWSLRTTALAVLASIPPFATAVFEVLADRRGLLRAPAAEAAETA